VLQETTASVQITVDSQAFDSGSGSRDKWVRDFLTHVSISGNAIPLTQGSFSEIAIPLTVTINDASQEVTFTTSVSLDETTLQAQGDAHVLLTDFGITPPDLANIYVVDDALKLSFDITASR
jgi:polyisoprenoid-binding protein YceI